MLGVGFIVKKIVGTQNERRLRKMRPLVQTINAFEPGMQQLSDEALKSKTEEFRKRLAEDRKPNDLLPEAFATVREAGRRFMNMRHFDVQLIGGMVLHGGGIAEMATGEGKTLVATLAAYLNALEGKGVHIVTVNDYLARRDADWMRPIYEGLGLTVAALQQTVPPHERRELYKSDILYGTNSEFGFDYLRDNQVVDLSFKAQRGHHYAIVDEVDSILIDEARTPLIISGPAEESTDKYYKIDKIIPKLEKDKHYEIDEKARTATLTEDGIRHCEELLGMPDLYENVRTDIIHHINQALRAHAMFKLDVDYVVKDNQVMIVDEFTGRLMPDRRFSDGLHQALEAKEGVEIKRENQTLATVTLQNYYRKYKKLAGMTGTAETEAVEFEKIYKLSVTVIPTNKPLRRVNSPDCIYRTRKEKFKAVIDEIKQKHGEGRPVLVGTASIEVSEQLSAMLQRENFPHNVLNAKYHEREAEIIARAGQESAITISTNMAGRGTDIVLGPGVADKGGLHVVGTERHEARRIDNQLRGRSGRQGDPGSSIFYISLEDDLMRIFGSDRISGLMQKLGMEEGQEIQHPLVSRALETAQKRVEGMNFEIRKHLLEYDDVMNRQREIIYEERSKVLEAADLREHVLEMLADVLEDLVLRYWNTDVAVEDREVSAFKNLLLNKFGLKSVDWPGHLEPEDLHALLLEDITKIYEEKAAELSKELMLYWEKRVLLQLIDSKWKEHLHALDNLRQGIGLRAYGQRDPLVEYKKEAFQLFDQLTEGIKNEAIEYIFRLRPVRQERFETVLSAAPQEMLHPEASALSPGAQGGGPASAAVPSLLSGRSEDRPESKPEPVQRRASKVGRNDPCPCGSGKKYKKCHGA
ncbi:MAG: preprotein translocase subunit SecA [Candidatus Omnitrophica bacterium]|nr:preprotein translocase subunit SecA [Candidatus Omnitrophota bacterium]